MGELLAKAIGEPVQKMWHDAMIVFDHMNCDSECGCYKCSCSTHAQEENEEQIKDESVK